VLRLLRYYRFEARFGTGDGDEPARAACRAAAHLLPTLSVERVAQELMRLLETPDPGRALQMMSEDGALAVVLPEARRLDRLGRIISIEPEPDALRRLAALIEADADGAAALAERLHFPNAWRERLRGLAPSWSLDSLGGPAAQRRALYRLGAVRYRDTALLLAADGGMSSEQLANLLALARDWTAPEFPISGHDVTALGIPPGPRVGALLDAVERWWEAGDFAADRDHSLAYLRELAESGGTPPLAD
jgi:poly(A) polymerase